MYALCKLFLHVGVEKKMAVLKDVLRKYKTNSNNELQQNVYKAMWEFVDCCTKISFVGCKSLK